MSRRKAELLQVHVAPATVAFRERYGRTDWCTPVGVDTWEWSVRINYGARGLRELAAGLAAANLARGREPEDEHEAALAAGVAPVALGVVEVGGVIFKVTPAGGRWQLFGEGADWSFEASWRQPRIRSPDGELLQKSPTFGVTFRAHYLADKGWREAAAEVRAWLALLGEVGKGADAPTNRRVDVYMDVRSSAPCPEWMARRQFVTRASPDFGEEPREGPRKRGRPRKRRGAPPTVGVTDLADGSVWEDATHGTGGRRFRRERGGTTIDFKFGTRGREGTGYCRVYDKAVQARKEQLGHVQPQWRRLGWDGHVRVYERGQWRGSIYRVEFEALLPVLEERGLRFVDDLLRIGPLPLWAFFTQEWLRLVKHMEGTGEGSRGRERGVLRRELRDVHPFWQLVQAGAGFTVPAGKAVPRAPSRRAGLLLKSSAGSLATELVEQGMDADGMLLAVFHQLRHAVDSARKKLHRAPRERVEAVRDGLERVEELLGERARLLRESIEASRRVPASVERVEPSECMCRHGDPDTDRQNWEFIGGAFACRFCGSVVESHD